MTDREMLEFAAKAAGMRVRQDGNGGFWINVHIPWNPLTDDGDALRLAVKCRIEVYEGVGDGPEAWAGYYTVDKRKFCCEPHENDLYAATRRAIVRAAAEIGKVMP